MSSTLILLLLVLKSATSSLCPHLQECGPSADAEFLHDFSSHSMEPSPYQLLELTVSSKDNGTYQLQLDVNDAVKPLKKVLLQLCGANTTYFISSHDVITSTCNTWKDLVMIKNCGSSDLYVSVFSPYDQALTIRYFIQDLTDMNVLYSGQLLLELSRVKSFREIRSISSVEGYFIVAAQYSIARVSLDGQRSIVLSSNASNARAIDYDFRQNVMYWTDVDQQVIMRSYLNGSSKVALLTVGLQNPDGLAVDWINNKIYFTDSALDIVGVFDPISFHYTVLLRSEASAQPRAIVLDPINRMMYWSDWGSVARIEKASMDGSGRVVIHNTSLTWPNALTLDIPSQTLYWADARLDRVESSGVDGSNRRLISDSGVSHPFGMVMHNSVLYFSDWSDDTIRSIGSNDSSASTAYSLFSCSRPSGIQIVDQLRQPSAPNPCEPSNGGCSHLCLLSTASGGFTCACPDGMTLQGNTNCVDSGSSVSIQPLMVLLGLCGRAGFTSCCSNSSCLGSPANCYCDSQCFIFGDCCSDVASDCRQQGTYLIVAAQSSIIQLSMDGMRQRIAISDLAQGRAIDYDFRRNFIYWTDAGTRQIMRANMDGSQVTTLLRRGLEEPDGLAVDWVNNKLYFTDMELNIVGVFDPVRLHYLVLVRTGSLSEPRAIVLDPGNRMMYWSDWGSVARIEKASMDGSGRVVIHSANLTWPNALALEILSQTLYWADASLDRVESSGVDGSNRQLISSSGIGHPFAIAVKDQSLYFTDWRPNSIRQISHPRGSGIILHTPPSCAQPFGIQVVDQLKQPLAFNPCEPGNGGCSHLCLLSTASEGFTCACPDGMTLEGNTSCVDDTSVSSPVQPQEVTPGSCMMVGYGSTCCTGTSCQGSSSLDACYCDARCQTYRDCCSDACMPEPTEQPTFAPVIQFHTRPSDITVNESSTAIFQCALVSPLPPEAMIQWWFTRPGTEQRQLVADQQGPRNANYTVLVSTGSLALVIQSVYFTQNQETYICRVQLGSTIEEASAILTVLFPPRSLEITGESDVSELSQLTLSCTVQASPAPVITWLRRSEGEVTVVLNTTRTAITSQYNLISATGVSILSIERAEPADQGEFVCQASNQVAMNTVAAARAVRIPAYNDCMSSRLLCQNGGECIDLVESFSCICTSGFVGNTCQLTVIQGNDTSSRPVFQEPPSSINPDLISPVNLTCTAEGSPAPSYLWYKDGVLIPGETREFLYIEETQPEDRGNYTCVAINEGGQVESDPARLKIPGLYQYNVSILFQAEASDASLENLLLMIASSNVPGTPASVYSVDIIDLTPGTDEVNLLVTLRDTQPEDTSVPILRQFLRRHMQSFSSALVSFSVQQIRRFDGCESDEYSGYKWAETDLGDFGTSDCPCSEYLDTLAGQAVRYCGGDYSTGAVWSSEIDTSGCVAVMSSITSRLCMAADMALNSTIEVAAEVANITSNSDMLTAADISATTAVVYQITSDAINNAQVREEYLEIIDNIQQADPEAVFESQTVTQSSQRILESLATFTDQLSINETSSDQDDMKLVLGFDTFALQLQNIDFSKFNGQTFTVNLGSVENAIDSEGIARSSLKTSERVMKVLDNSTAAVQIPDDFSESLDECDVEGTATRPVLQQRLSYSVFLTDILFQSKNQSSFDVGSIIVSTRLRCVENSTLMNPITMIFRTVKQVNGTDVSDVSDGSCAMWDPDSDEFGAWSRSSCREVRVDSNNIECECDQLGHFGILFDLNPRPINPDAALALFVLTYIGIGMSLICLTILVITYLCARNLRQNTHTQIILNMSLSLAGLYIFFVLGGHVTSVPGLCGLSAALLHYFMLVFFAWTAVEAVWLYIKLVKVIGTHSYEHRYMWKAGIPAWGLPALIVVLSAGPGYQYYVSEVYCRAVQWPFWFGFLVPFLALYVFDWIMFIIILVSIAKHKQHLNKQTRSGSNYKHFKDSLIVALSLAVMFGLGWGFGLLATSYSVEAITITFQVIFSVFVGAQGVLLFLLHGVRNTDARRVWKNWWTTFSTSTRLSYAVSSTNKKTQDSNTTQSAAPSTPRILPRKIELSKTDHSVASEPVYHEVKDEVKHDLSLTPAPYEEATFSTGRFSFSENMSYGMVGGKNSFEGTGSASDNPHNHYEFMDPNAPQTQKLDA